MKTDFVKIAEILTQKGKTNYFVLIGIVGIVLLVSGGSFTIKEKTKTETGLSLEGYKDQLETELTSFIREIEGVGNAKVMISFASGQENIYAQTEKSSEDNNTNQLNTGTNRSNRNVYENGYVIISNSGQENALVEKTLQPEIQGVAVVCSGADDITVVAAVTNSVSAVLGVPTHKICVTKMR